MRAHAVLPALVLIGAAATSPPARAAMTLTYYFNANCEDCAIYNRVFNYGVLGVLTLRNYANGLTIDPGLNFEDFTYTGSNIVGPYHVGIDPQDGIPETLDFIFRLGSGSPDSVTGVMIFNFDIRFGDQLGFHADSTGAWYTCAPGPGWPAAGVAYQAGEDCSPFNNLDHGTGQWDTVQTVVLGPGASNGLPEPSALALLPLALLAASLARPRRSEPRRVGHR